MATEIRWTTAGLNSFDVVIDYLITNFTEKQVKLFISKVDKKIDFIASNPKMYPLSRKRKNIRSTFISKQTRLFYRYQQRKQLVEILLFWNNRQNPSKLSSRLSG